MRRNTVVIGALIVTVLLPMWYVALHGEPPSEEVAIDESVSDLRPLDGFVDTPNKLSPSQVGVVVWVALFGLVGVLTAVHRFMNDAVRPPDDASTAVSDGGMRPVSLPWLETGHRWIVEYHDASDAIEGLVAMGGLTVLALVFAALFTGEYLTLGRTQYFGIYATGMFVSLALSTVAYDAWFMPHIEVAENRGHEPWAGRTTPGTVRARSRSPSPFSRASTPTAGRGWRSGGVTSRNSSRRSAA